MSEEEVNLNIHVSPFKPVDLKKISDLHAEVEDINVTVRLCNFWRSN